MAGTSISGLASGLDTQTIISQLMQLEAVPQTKLKTQVSSHERAASSLQTVNAKIASLATKAEELAKPESWTSVSAKSSYDKVSVSTRAGATAGNLAFTINELARPHQLTFNTVAKLDTVVTGTGTTVVLDKNDGTDPISIDTKDGTLKGLVTALNTSGQGLRATPVKLDNGDYRLRIESVETGKASDFTLSAPGGSEFLADVTVAAGKDAAITVGTDRIHSTSNTFSDLLPGVSVTLKNDAAVDQAVSVELSTDAASMSSKVKGLVDSINSVLSDIDSVTRNGNGKDVVAGTLAGDSTLREVRGQLLDTLYSATGGSLFDVGVQLDRSGKFTFDESKFKAAYEKDPAATAARFTKSDDVTGFADRLATLAKSTSDPYDGTISTAIKGRKSTVDRLNLSIEDWDRRLELRRSTLTRQYTALETALSNLNSQSNWLAGQISSLSANSR
jgi:flagellar hook-associated protein 2